MIKVDLGVLLLLSTHTCRVIHSALLGVRQGLVSPIKRMIRKNEEAFYLLYNIEVLNLGLFGLVDVWMVLLGELVVLSLDLFIRCCFVDPEYIV